MAYNYDGQYPYNNPTPNTHPYQVPPAFYQELQQYAAPQYQQPPPSRPAPQVQVIVPSHQHHPQYHQPQPQPGYHFNQHFVPPQQPQYYQFQQQYPVNGYSAMAPSQPSSRPPSMPQQNGAVPTPSSVPIKVEPRQSTTPLSEPDYPVLLLSLADEYFAAAANLNDQSESYFKLLSTGLGCLESVLSNFKLPALREAQLSLRYAQVLYDETENYDDAERVLTKAIDVCERNKFIDLKYALQLLLARVLYQSKPKAAIKDLQTMIEEIEAYKHTAWEYATRYQLVTFYSSAAAVRDLHTAIHQIEKLLNSASNNGDKSIAAFANTVCALLHLQTASPDAVSSSQQALAKARALQTDEAVASIPQITIMMEFIDLCCSIRECNHEQVDQKRRRLQDVWTKIVDEKGWAEDGDTLFLPVKKSSLRGVQLQQGGLVGERNGRHVLPFTWIAMNDAEAWGFLLCAVSKAHKNASDGGKAEQFIEAGLERARSLTDPLSKRGVVRTPQQKILECRFFIELAFLKCQKGLWEEAQNAVNSITTLSKEVGEDIPHNMLCIIQYLKGTIQHGLGNLDTALQVYQSPVLDLGQFSRGSDSSHHHRSQDSETDTDRNIAILAAMNRLLIINDRSHPQHNHSPALIEQLNPLIKASQDKNIQTSYTLIHSLITQTGILRSKQSLISALNSAKAISNAQITALVLMTMHQKHFINVTDEHANKCVKATSLQMKNWGNAMWMHVTAGMEAQHWEFQGKTAEANVKMEEARRRAAGLPAAIRERIQM